MRIPYSLSAHTKPTPELIARADELLRDAPAPLQLGYVKTRIYPCVLVFCGVEYFAAIIHGPVPGPGLPMPAVGGGYWFGFINPSELRYFCRRGYNVDLARHQALAKKASLNFLQRIVYAQIGLPNEYSRQGWGDYLKRSPRTDAKALYMRARAGTALYVDRDIAFNRERENDQRLYNVTINELHWNFGFEEFMPEEAQCSAMRAFSDECRAYHSSSQASARVPL